MNTARRTKKVALTGALAATALAVATAVPAHAANGYVSPSGGGGSSHYVDNGDSVGSCDGRVDGHGVIGWIKVQNADGSWKTYPRVYNGKGADTCRSLTQDVVRESALINITSCLVDGQYGTPYNCKSLLFSGA